MRVQLVKIVEVSGLSQKTIDDMIKYLPLAMEAGPNKIVIDFAELHEWSVLGGPSAEGTVFEALNAAHIFARDHDVEEIWFSR